MKIRLSRDTLFSTGYIGRGIQPKNITLKAGTEVDYSRLLLNSGEVVHTISVTIDGVRYEANERRWPKDRS